MLSIGRADRYSRFYYVLWRMEWTVVVSVSVGPLHSDLDAKIK